MRATIYLWGCDDSTKFTLDIEKEEVHLLERIALMSEEVSTYQCMPTFGFVLEDENE